MSGSDVVITGVGFRIPGASDMAGLEALYRAGLPATRTLPGRMQTWAGGLVVDEAIDNADLKQMDRVSILAVAAARDAVAAAGWGPEDLTDAGVYVGCGGGGLMTQEEASINLVERDEAKGPTLVKTIVNAPTAQVSMGLGCHGPSFTYAMACSSSAHSVGEAMLAIRSGRCDRVVAGGTEAPMAYGVHRAWAALRLLAMGGDAKCRPFCYERGGVLLGEGSVFFTLERRAAAEARGAVILATIRGYGARSDATHITAPNAQGQAATIEEAVRTSGLTREDIGHVAAHGTATLAGDVSETAALHAVFGDHAKALMVSGTKSFHGHLLGGAGAVSLLASILAVSRGFIAPTVNFGTPEAELDLDYVPNQAREKVNVRASLCNAFGFGGSNASLVLTP